MNITDQMSSAVDDTDIDLDRLTRVAQSRGGRLRRRRRATAVGAPVLAAVVLGLGTSALLVRDDGPDRTGPSGPADAVDSNAPAPSSSTGPTFGAGAPVPTPIATSGFPVNSRGQTYGSDCCVADRHADGPDLVAVRADSGVLGFVLRTAMYPDDPTTAAGQLDVYDYEGEVVVGVYTLGGGGGTGPTPVEDRPTRAELDGAACWALPGDVSFAVPSRDAAVFVAGCLTGNKPRLDGMTRRAVTLFRERWAASTQVPSTDLARCADDQTMGPGYATVYTDRGEWVSLSRSPCGYLTFTSSDTGATYAVPVTFEELGIDDDLRRTCEAYFLGKGTSDPCP